MFPKIITKTVNFQSSFLILTSLLASKKSLKIPKIIRIRKSKKNRQCNGPKKKDKRANNDLQNMQIKLKVE